ncbi:hypothetical protein Mpsy_2421 [Methanolobus psychrophilus R15]|nr:hypothetical protein Mpsy_2421 [Methanolobus psychrophilus R15]
MTYKKNGKQIPYGLYYLTSDDCPVCGTIPCVKRCSYYLSAGGCSACESKELIEKLLCYISVDSCPARESKECVERYYKDIEEFSGIELGKIKYVNLSHEKNPTDVKLKTVPIFVEYNEIGRYVRVDNRVFCSGYPLINKDVVWENWRFNEDTRKKMDENRRTRTKELIIEDIKAGCLCWIVYCRCYDKELVKECWKQVKGEAVSLNEEAEEVTIIHEETGNVIFRQKVLFFGNV